MLLVFGSVREAVLSRLDGTERKILSYVIEHRRAMPREDPAAKLNRSSSGGAYQKAMSRLHALEMIVYPKKGMIQAAAWIFADETESRT